MTLVLLDTNAYLRLAKRIKPMLGVKFGQKEYVLTILKDVENEVQKNPRLRFHYPWFQDPSIATERLAKRIRLSGDEKAELDAAMSVLHGWVLGHVQAYISPHRSPPSSVDCRVLAFGRIRPAIVVTDDLGMHQLATDFEFGDSVWHGHELLKKMLSAKVIDANVVREIYDALETNDDLPRTWREVRHTAFRKIFGPPP